MSAIFSSVNSVLVITSWEVVSLLDKCWHNEDQFGGGDGISWELFLHYWLPCAMNPLMNMHLKYTHRQTFLKHDCLSPQNSQNTFIAHLWGQDGLCLFVSSYCDIYLALVIIELYVVSHLATHIDGLVQDCSISIANTLEILQSCTTLRWRHNGRSSISNHQSHDCLLNRLFRRRSKKTSKLCVTGLCAGNSPGTGEFPAQMASNTENVSIWWHHHETMILW